jgi:nitrogen fixation NifU-like protein
MTDLEELYQDLIIDHNKRPRNRRKLEPADRKAEGYNPLCGDRVIVYLKLDGDTVIDVAFEGAGCAISTASASLMTEALKGKKLEEARKLFATFQRLVRGEGKDENGAGLGKLAVFSGVSKFPMRVKCASLPWHTVLAAMEKKNETVTTE